MDREGGPETGRAGGGALPGMTVQGEVLAEDCPSRAILQHVTSRYGALALVAMARGIRGFAEMQAAAGANDRVLGQTLQRLEADGLVARNPHGAMAREAEYHLTALGSDLAAKVEALAGWIEQNLQGLLTAQLEYARQRKSRMPTASDDETGSADDQDIA